MEIRNKNGTEVTCEYDHFQEKQIKYMTFK